MKKNPVKKRVYDCMASQIFISYRRDGGDVTAKLLCESLKNRGYTVFYDFDALKAGRFDTKILKTIEECSDFVVVLPPHGLDRCVSPDDWVRQEIAHAITHRKNIIPVMLGDFAFPDELPDDIDQLRLYTGGRFVMDYFDAVMDKLVERLVSKPHGTATSHSKPTAPEGREPSAARDSQPRKAASAPTTCTVIVRRRMQYYSAVRKFKILMDGREVGAISVGQDLSFPVRQGTHTLQFSVDWLTASIDVTCTPDRPAVVEVYVQSGLWQNKLICHRVDC
jgi:hypothetical protein